MERDAGADVLAEAAMKQVDDGKVRAFTPDLVSAGNWGQRPGSGRTRSLQC
jgi:hypothetical protein